MTDKPISTQIISGSPQILSKLPSQPPPVVLQEMERMTGGQSMPPVGRTGSHSGRGKTAVIVTMIVALLLLVIGGGAFFLLGPGADIFSGGDPDGADVAQEAGGQSSGGGLFGGLFDGGGSGGGDALYIGNDIGTETKAFTIDGDLYIFDATISKLDGDTIVEAYPSDGGMIEVENPVCIDDILYYYNRSSDLMKVTGADFANPEMLAEDVQGTLKTDGENIFISRFNDDTGTALCYKIATGEITEKITQMHVQLAYDGRFYGQSGWSVMNPENEKWYSQGYDEGTMTEFLPGLDIEDIAASASGMAARGADGTIYRIVGDQAEVLLTPNDYIERVGTAKAVEMNGSGGSFCMDGRYIYFQAVEYDDGFADASSAVNSDGYEAIYYRMDIESGIFQEIPLQEYSGSKQLQVFQAASGWIYHDAGRFRLTDDKIVERVSRQSYYEDVEGFQVERTGYVYEEMDIKLIEY
jgi:hypothetical protein